MFPDTNIQQAASNVSNKKKQGYKDPRKEDVPSDILEKEFVGETRSQLATLTGEIADRNKTILQNDGYIYGDLLSRSLDIPIGHDITAVNWLKRTVEIHRTQFMGRGFTVTSTYDSTDVTTVDDPNEQQRIVIENEKMKAEAEARRQIIDSIIADNGGFGFFANLAENASAIGDSVVKGWYDETKGMYILQQVEAVENVFALWNKDDYRDYDAIAYVYQVSKQEAQRRYGVGPDVATSPLGMPLAVLSSANSVQYLSTQPMVTIMEVCGRIQGWCSVNGTLKRCAVGSETEMCVYIVGNEVYQLEDDVKYIPHYYILPNKKARRRPWGIPDVSQSAIQLNLTYIETFSDWRTLASKVNFPKFKYLNFAPGTQLPKPKARQVEGIPLVEGQDIQPLSMPNSAGLGEQDFQHQLNEIQTEYVREVGISRVLFDMPDEPSDSNRSMLTSMKSIGDLTEAKRQIWTPVIIKMFEDALTTLGNYDDNIKQLVSPDEIWHLRVQWPSMLNKDDPVYQTMMLNRFNANLISVQSYMEAMGDDKEELDRITEELQNKDTAAIHGHQIGTLAQYKIMPPFSQMPPKVSVNLRGDLTPNQEADIAQDRGIVTDQSTFPNTIGPQGFAGLKATDTLMNQGLIAGQQAIGMATQKDAQGNDVPALQPGGQGAQPPGGPQGAPQQSQAPIGTPANNTPGTQPLSQPGSGAPQVSAQGAHNQHKQKHGK